MELQGFEKISVYDLESAAKLIGKDWMLITAKDEERGSVNAMTASWGCMGVLWNKPVAVCFIRPQRYTYGLAEKANRLSLAFFGDGHRDALKLCGTKSGRDCDKLREAGLSRTEADGVPVIAEAELLLICRKLYADDIKEEGFLDSSLLANYSQKDYHRIYVCEIESAYRKIK
ncbi:MAG: flavin reductase family protein [Clostridia bacterium]|nr:flavin reductase family protein [Clostridia bacterium]